MLLCVLLNLADDVRKSFDLGIIYYLVYLYPISIIEYYLSIQFYNFKKIPLKMLPLKHS